MIYFESSFFHDQICEVLGMHFIGRVLHDFTFNDHFASTVCQGSLRNNANQVPGIPRAAYVIKIRNV